MERGPLRTCVGCRTTRRQAELIRVVATPEGPIAVTYMRGSVPGRGAYLCGNRACVERALESGALLRALRIAGPIPEDLVARLLRVEVR